jgi:hypothetical protein
MYTSFFKIRGILLRIFINKPRLPQSTLPNTTETQMNSGMKNSRCRTQVLLPFLDPKEKRTIM